jgi:hypothetical protein
MKKLMMSSDEYYNRKTVGDYMDDEFTSHEGCRNLAALLMALFILGVLATLFLMV